MKSNFATSYKVTTLKFHHDFLSLNWSNEFLTRGRSVSFTFRILLECIRYCNSTIAQVLPIHCLHCRIRRIKAGKVDERKAFAVSCFWVTHYLWGLQDHTECTERVIQQLLIHFWVKISNEQVCPNIQVLLMSRRLNNWKQQT